VQNFIDRGKGIYYSSIIYSFRNIITMQSRKKVNPRIDWAILEFKAEALKALAHPTRLAIVELLLDGEQCVCELIRALAMEQAIVSKHLQVLKGAGIVISTKKGLNVHYAIACPCIRDLVREISKTLKAIARRQHELLVKL
jgi:DNA-binding transcriptional ArsR family regulator